MRFLTINALNPNFQCDSIWEVESLGSDQVNEGGNFMSKMDALIKETSENSRTFHQVTLQRKTAVCEPSSGLSLDPTCRAFELELSLRNQEKRFSVVYEATQAAVILLHEVRERYH